MKNLILVLLIALFGAACATEIDDAPPDDRSMMEVISAIIGDGGVCRDSSGQPCWCGGFGCDDGGLRGPDGSQGWGGGSTSYACQNQIGCYQEQIVTPQGFGRPLTCAVIGETSACGNPHAQICGVWSAVLMAVKCGGEICSTYPLPTFQSTLCGNTDGDFYGGRLNGNCSGYAGNGCVGEIPPPPPPPSGGGGGGSTNPPCHGSGCTVEQSNPTQTQ